MKKIILLFIIISFVGVSIGSIYAQSQYEIPSWVKGVAGFWADDKISDSEFGDGISFLIDNKIIKVPKIQQLENTITQQENKIAQLEAENKELRNKISTETESSKQADCDPSYPDVCIPPYPPDLNCGDIMYSNFRVLQPDPHGFDRDSDGIGCES